MGEILEFFVNNKIRRILSKSLKISLIILQPSFKIRIIQSSCPISCCTLQTWKEMKELEVDLTSLFLKNGSALASINNSMICWFSYTIDDNRAGYCSFWFSSTSRFSFYQIKIILAKSILKLLRSNPHQLLFQSTIQRFENCLLNNSIEEESFSKKTIINKNKI